MGRAWRLLLGGTLGFGLTWAVIALVSPDMLYETALGWMLVGMVAGALVGCFVPR